jgi:membrane protein DedA with SNARE-associated domain
VTTAEPEPTERARDLAWGAFALTGGATLVEFLFDPNGDLWQAIRIVLVALLVVALLYLVFTWLSAQRAE